VGVSPKSLPRGQKSASEAQPTGAHSSEVSRHLLRVQEEERKRISRELHDGTGQGLMVLRLYLGMLGNEAASPEAHGRIQEALALLDRTIEDLRRIIRRLSPRTLEELGLLAAIRKEATETSKNSGIEVVLGLPKEIGEVDHETQVALYRSVQEALHNIARHSQATRFHIEVERQQDVIRLLVEDDGVGFSSSNGARRGAFGLLGMRDRIAALNGSVRIRSRKGKGTRILIALPAILGERRTAMEQHPGPGEPRLAGATARNKLARQAASAAAGGSKANSHTAHGN
jgi:two-component system, NarL family, sensor histidine kinase NreB